MSRSCRGVERRILRHLHECKTRTQLPQIHAQFLRLFLRYNLHHSSQILSHFLAVCGSLRQMKYANSVFLQFQNPSILLFNPMIKGYSLCPPFAKSIQLFCTMKTRGIWPNEFTFVPLLKSCSNISDLKIGQAVHGEVVLLGFGSFSAIRIGIVEDGGCEEGKALVDFYCKRGDLDTAFMVFEEMPRKNVVSWNSLISGLAFNGKGERGVALFDEMIHNGLCPSDSTFVGVLACCVHAGFVQRGRVLFDQMVSNHHLKPKQEHYGCMVDLLGRNGFVDEAHELIVSMTIKPNAALWGALLSACRIHGNMELAECATKELINLEPWNSGNYVQLSNIYAERGRWDEVEKVRLEMAECKIKKAPGQSMVG